MIATNEKVGDSDATNCWMPCTVVVCLLFKEYCNTPF